jgi:hypothetical protein
MFTSIFRKISDLLFGSKVAYWVVVYETFSNKNGEIMVDLKKINVLHSTCPPKYVSEFGVHKVKVLGPFSSLELANQYRDVMIIRGS